jgi:dephospho-CoA kinase
MAHRFVVAGGIGSGKSAAVAVFETLGASALYADEFARAALAPGSDAAVAVATRWPAVMDGDLIDRTALGRIVFADPVELAALEELTHPETEAALQAAVAELGDDSIVVEIPILRDWFDGWPLVVVDAPEEVRLERAAARSDLMTPADVQRVMERQPLRAEWLLAADYVVDNSGDWEQLREQCHRVWERLPAI